MPLILLALKRLGGWLSSLTLWQIVSLALSAILVLQHFRLADARHDRDAWKRQYTLIHTQLEAISSKRNGQKSETAERIRVVAKEIRHADDRAKVIEAAPLPGNCKSPSEIMGADL